MSSRGYKSPGIEIIESEVVLSNSGETEVTYGLVGVAQKGPYGLTRVSSIEELHDKFGYANLGKDTDGKDVVSQAIVLAERILTNTSSLIFSRVHLSQTQADKLVRTSDDKMSFTIANNDTSIKTITVSALEKKATVKVERVTPSGSTYETVLVSDITTEENLKKALEYEGTLINVTVPDGYIEDITEETTISYELTTSKPADWDTNWFSYYEVVSEEYVPVSGESAPTWTASKYYRRVATHKQGNPDIYVPNFDILDINLTNEIAGFSNEESVDVSVLAAPLGTVIEIGCADLDAKIAKYKTVNDKLIAITASRNDCMVLLDYPIDLGYNNAVSLFSSASYNFDNQEVAICYPGVKTTSLYSVGEVELSSSCILMDRMAYTDKVDHCWYSPAGYGNNRGILTNVSSVNVELTKEMRDTLYELKVNPIVKFVGRGVVLFGNRSFKTSTPFSDPSVFEKLQVVRLSNYVKKVVKNISIGIIFGPNDEISWKQWEVQVSSQMEKIKQNRGIEKYIVRMDSTTVSEDDKLNGRAPGVIRILPIGAIEWITINYVLTNDSASFEGGE